MTEYIFRDYTGSVRYNLKSINSARKKAMSWWVKGHELFSISISIGNRKLGEVRSTLDGKSLYWQTFERSKVARYRPKNKYLLKSDGSLGKQVR